MIGCSNIFGITERTSGFIIGIRNLVTCTSPNLVSVLPCWASTSFWRRLRLFLQSYVKKTTKTSKLTSFMNQLYVKTSKLTSFMS
jgi:hypothetical protein